MIKPSQAKVLTLFDKQTYFRISRVDQRDFTSWSAVSKHLSSSLNRALATLRVWRWKKLQYLFCFSVKKKLSMSIA